MRNRSLMAAIAAIICVPLIFAFAGGGRHTGLVIGVVLVLVGIAWGVFGPRDPDDDGRPRPGR
jgi:hypothetical protein